MRLFSEEVKITSSNSPLNILQVKDFQEVFFGVFEVQINENKYVAEKISEENGNPIVSILVEEGDEKVQYPFLLLKGKQEIYFNSESEPVEIFESNIENDDDKDLEIREIIEETFDNSEIVEDKKQEILEEIKRVKRNAIKKSLEILEHNKARKIQDIKNEGRKKEKALKEYLESARENLVGEFTIISGKIKNELISDNDYKFDEIRESIDLKIQDIADNLNESLRGNFQNSSKLIDKSVKKLVRELYESNINPKVDKELKDIAEEIVEKVSEIDKNLNNKLNEKADVSLIEGVNRELDAIRDANIELNNSLNKGVQKALSRVGNVDKRILEISEKFDNKISETEQEITQYFDEKLSLVKEETLDITDEARKYFQDLIQESRNGLLSEIRKIKNEKPVEYILESKKGKPIVKDWDSIEKDWNKKIHDKFENYKTDLRKYVAVYASGGGTNATQYQDGGTMNGDLNVTGQYLSAGVDLLTIFSGGSDDTYVNTLVRSNSANWDDAYNTSVIYQSNSASYATIDFTNSKFFPLSGGTVTGSTTFNNNVTIQGNLTALGTTTFSNTIFSVTSALSVVHVGGGPAMWVGNNGTGDIASFYDIDQNIEVLHVGGVNSTFPNVGVHTSTPNERFTVSGNISASGSVFANNLVYTTGDQTLAGVKTFSNNIVGNGTANRLPNQLAVASSDIITKGLADARYTSRNERITDDTTFLQTTWEQFLDFDDQYNADLTLAAASGGTTFAVSPAVFGDVWTTTNAGVTAFNGNDAHTHRGIFLVRGPTASSQSFYIGINRTTIPYNLTNRIDEFTCRVFVGSNDFRTQGYFKIGIIPKGGTGGADQSLRGGLIFNPYLHATNLVLGVNKAATASPYTFTTTSANVDFLDTGVNFIDLLDKWVNITYKLDRSAALPVLTIIIVRENVILFQASYNIATDPVVSTWARRADLYVLGASNEIGIQNGKFTYTSRSQLHIDYLYYKVTGTSAAPSNWNSLRF